MGDRRETYANSPHQYSFSGLTAVGFSKNICVRGLYNSKDTLNVWLK
nr:MAG TPA_asm: hypothetical protein [Caudoviricetes sp.]